MGTGLPATRPAYRGIATGATAANPESRGGESAKGRQEVAADRSLMALLQVHRQPLPFLHAVLEPSLPGTVDLIARFAVTLME